MTTIIVFLLLSCVFIRNSSTCTDVVIVVKTVVNTECYCFVSTDLTFCLQFVLTKCFHSTTRMLYE